MSRSYSCVVLSSLDIDGSIFDAILRDTAAYSSSLVMLRDSGIITLSLGAAVVCDCELCITKSQPSMLHIDRITLSSPDGRWSKSRLSMSRFVTWCLRRIPSDKNPPKYPPPEPLQSRFSFLFILR